MAPAVATIKSAVKGSYLETGPSSAARRRMAKVVQRTISCGVTGYRFARSTTPPPRSARSVKSICPCRMLTLVG